MTDKFSYTFYCCPCTDINSRTDPFATKSEAAEESTEKDEEEQQTFNPHSPRADYALFPLEHLLFCNDCHEIRCPRCYYEESLYYYCPSCLFESQPTLVKNETNRCTRSCFQCPICIAPLSLSVFQSTSGGDNGTKSQRDGPFILSCPYCSWTSLEIGITFEKSLNISGQLAKIANGGAPFETSTDGGRDTNDGSAFDDPRSPGKLPAPNDRFSQLANFYKKQIQDTTPGGSFGMGNSGGPESPGNFSRMLMNTYGAGASVKKPKPKIPTMREAQSEAEGLRMHSDDKDDEVIARMRELGWSGTTSISQRAEPPNSDARLVSDLRPIATRLRAKRAKRCRACRNFIVKPEDKRQGTRYKIKLVALQYIPRITLRPLDPAIDRTALKPAKTMHFLLTLRNPLFEAVNVTLATPATTPGRVSSSVTILCPQFRLGANVDAWEEALDTEGPGGQSKGVVPVEGQQPEAGKLWARGRNWTTVVLEVVPGKLDVLQADEGKGEAGLGLETSQSQDVEALQNEVDGIFKDTERQINEDVLEVPISVRLEYETDTDDAIHSSRMVSVALEEAGTAVKKERAKREVAFWCVIGVGRIAG